MYAKECDSKRVEAVEVYQAKLAVKTTKRHQLRLYNVVFLILYVLQLGWVISTIGEPYRKFLEKADREGFQVMEGATKLRAQLEYALGDINDPNRRLKKIGWFDWMDMDIEELAAEKKKDKERSVLDSLPKSMRVPSKYTANFWPTLLLGVLATLHALVLLMQVWSVKFNVWINYQEMNAEKVELPESLLQVDLDEDAAKQKERKESAAANKTTNNGGFASLVPDRVITDPPSHLPTHARVQPAKGKDVLIPLQYYPTLGMTFEYHRRRYVWQPKHGVWTKIRCQTKFDLQVLDQYTGLATPHRVIAGEIKFGPNMFNVTQPNFLDLYKAQLLNPFSVFQIFCVLLWAIDDYIIYSFFSLFMVLTFEATVVFQRLKSMQSLRGMGNPHRVVHVFRCGFWGTVDTSELLPGDIISLVRIKPHAAKNSDGSLKSSSILGVEDEGGDIVPADLLLLRGSTVVNEASLTGESVPQMKEGLVDAESGDPLDMKNKHKMNIAYAGTKMLQCKGAPDYLDDDKNEHGGSGASRKPYKQIPSPPDNGCVCFVLRTGFASAQGKLVRMIEGSQEKVKGHERETGLLLALLCIFAIISSSYVLYHGVQNENRSKYELLLHCILIVTNVIRPELPMQMALAVNNSLMLMLRQHIFCTEPYRVPLAGKLDACLFDKTGTLTTDELVAVGICEPSGLSKTDEDDNLLTHMTKVVQEAALVLAGCHSLVVVDEETTGDPLENAALSSMRWHLDVKSGNALPAPATEKKAAGKNIVLSSGQQISEVSILSRHHFSSKLQRMSCVIKAGGKTFAVVKGSSEIVGTLLRSKPNGYDEKARFLSKSGYRVIGLAYKALETKELVDKAIETRSSCEEGLEFAGFIAFTCMVRKDTASVLQRLKEGGMSVAMVTGDALLTAIHVAKEVKIFEPLDADDLVVEDEVEQNEEIKQLLESKRKDKIQKPTKPKKSYRYKPILYLDTNEKHEIHWYNYEDGKVARDYVAKNVPELVKTHDLAVTGKVLELAYEYDADTSTILQHIKVFARMAPDSKEKVIDCLHSMDILSMMCGDGANDVGALKQADVGVALLSGFGNINVEKNVEEANKNQDESSSIEVRAIMSQEHLAAIRALPVTLLKAKLRSMGCDPAKYPELMEKEDLVKLYQIKARELAVKKHEKKNALDKSKMSKAELAAERQREMQEKQRAVMARAAELEAQGVQWATFKAMREYMAKEMEEGKKKKAELIKRSGVEGSAATLAAQFEDLETGDLPMVKLGDASIAAPFTSKMPSIKSCVDIVRQGRCTLVSSIQMYQIMALQCLISSYSLSVLYLDGVKYGDSQMTAMGLLGSISFMSVSRSKPLDKLSKVRPLSSIFHPALFASLLGQFTIHLTTMVVAVHSAKKYLPPDYEADLDGSFQPGILNTVVFLVSSVQQVTVFVVNLQGRPFMTGLTENRPLLWSLLGTFILTFMFASESVPGLNRYFQLVPFPDDKFRDFVLTILVMDLVGTFVFDRLMQFLFCRHILRASIEGTTWWDVFYLARTFAVIGFLMHAFLGNSETWELMLEMELNATAEANGTILADGLIEAVSSDEVLNVSVPSIMEELLNVTVPSIMEEL